MNIEEFRSYCLSLKGTSEALPFDHKTLVFKVMGKMFALTNLETFESINIKCDPEYAIELRETYEAVNPGYHMSKKHWNTITLDYSIDDNLLYEWIKDSYDLVVAKLTKKQKEALANIN
ncbi:MAG: MmcQ/YjbR family DNA-binding protein [Flavobacteriales bacterium]|jgi:predicted DNA-binding protein (MmcQ/YjbR family)|nr:MmcQ/YjbR family DNA-binding protein [Flavobacteriales bacterium]